MAASVMHGDHPDFGGLDQIEQAVKFEALQRGAAHIGKTDGVDFRMVREFLRGYIHFLQKVRAQTGNLRVIPERGLDRVGVSGRKGFYREVH